MEIENDFYVADFMEILAEATERIESARRIEQYKQEELDARKPNYERLAALGMI